MSDPLISATQLREALAAEPAAYRLLDVQWTLAGEPGSELYAAAHLPGARHLDVDSDLAAPPGAGGRHPLPSPDQVAAAPARCGVGRGDAVVVYDQKESFGAARAWWVLTNLGLTDVRVLDGGLAAWTAAGGETESGEPGALAEQPDPIELRPGNQPTLDVDEVQPFLWGKGVLLDARAPERYRGEVEPMDPVAGHIPGAVNSPTTMLANEDGTFRSADEIRARWELVSRHGRPEAVAVYCGSGVTAAHHILALTRIGIPAGLYPGSWSEWVTDPSRPVVTGAQPGSPR